jgi:hypothetical protein
LEIEDAVIGLVVVAMMGMQELAMLAQAPKTLFTSPVAQFLELSADFWPVVHR